MESVRVVPCLDVKDGRVVKGVGFVNLTDAGDPVSLARAYEEAGADEIVYLDITASHEGRGTFVDLVERTAAEVFIPLTVGGGVDSVEAASLLLRAGADKVSINSAAVRRPELIRELAAVYGSQCVVVAVDSKWNGHNYEIYTHGGRTPTGIDAFAWCERAVLLGAGELLATSMDRDGTRLGYDHGFLLELHGRTNVPVIASGGVGSLQHFVDGALLGKAQALLAASVFHFGEISVAEVKGSLQAAGVGVRPIIR